MTGTDPANKDTDDDGRTDGAEVRDPVNPTNPVNADSDNDTLSDGVELRNGLDPNDSSDAGADGDGDGLSAVQELEGTLNPFNAAGVNVGVPPSPDPTRATSPDDSDSDGDGVSDGDELLLTQGNMMFITNPNSDDTDNDGMTDKFELDNGLDPTTDDSTEDPDNDDLTNLAEFMAGTKPNDADSDDDGLRDDFESAAGSPTDPTITDTDGDGLADGAENSSFAAGEPNGVPVTDIAQIDRDAFPEIFFDDIPGGIIYDSDPSLADTDGDEVLDGDEVAAGTDPNNFSDSPTPAPVAYFPFERAGGIIADDVIDGKDAIWADANQDDLTWEAGLFGNAANLNGNDDGSNNWFDIPTLENLAGAQGITLSVWINPNDVTKNEPYSGVIMTRSEGTNTNESTGNWGIAIRDNGDGAGATQFGDFRGRGVPINTAANAITEGSWQHLAITLSSSGDFSAYRNGVLFTAIAGQNNPVPNISEVLTGSGWNIGNDPLSPARNYDGLIDDLAFFRISLGESGIQEIYNRGLNGEAISDIYSITVPPIPPVGPIPVSTISVDGNNVSITFESTPGTTYAVNYSLDLNGFANVAIPSITGEADPATSTTATFDISSLNGNVLPNRAFFQIVSPAPTAP